MAKKRFGGLTKKVSLADVRRLRADGDGDSPKKPDERPSKGSKGKEVHKARRLHDDGDSPKKPDERPSKGGKGKKAHKARRLHDDGDSPKKARRKATVRRRDGDGDSPKKTVPAKPRRTTTRLLGGRARKK